MSESSGEIQTDGLSTPVGTLKGVGPKREQALEAASLHSVGDLLAHLPKRHRVLPPVRPFADCEDGQLITVRGTVLSLVHRRSQRSRGGHLHVQIDVGGETVGLNFFNQGYLKNSIVAGQPIRATGTVKLDPKPSLSPIHYQVDDDLGDDLLILSDYRLPAGLKAGQFSTLIRDSIRQYGDQVSEPLPESILSKRGFLGLTDALRAIHNPQSHLELEQASKRLTYNAFLVGALSAVGESKEANRSTIGVIPRDEKREAEIKSVLPFNLTEGQDEALEDILNDLADDRPMRRMLQGDVGCGKTAVAGLAALAVAKVGKQVALLAPTEVLARQLHSVVSSWSERVGCTAALVVGGMRVRERRQVLEGLASGKTSIAIGTHAIFQKPVKFKSLGLVIVDEQHRFGVLQRLRLVRKGRSPHLLAMSATPIPRTLAMTLYSDLQLSSIHERPGQRQPVETFHHVRDLDGHFDWQGLADKARQGMKCFVVFPGIESENESFPTLLGLGRMLARRFFKGIGVAALHGRMKDKEKEEKLEAFRAGSVTVLFATTVIEVGVDVPDAQQIVIVGADRFGLAQLHQLRGRVGRGVLPGECHLLTKSKKSADSERLALLTECHDGFLIAEHDLELRGPGDMMGLKQHGHGPMSSPSDDEGLLLSAFEDARALLESKANVELLKSILSKFAWHRRRRSRGYEDAG